jgi:hypothetical protein
MAKLINFVSTIRHTLKPFSWFVIHRDNEIQTWDTGYIVVPDEWDYDYDDEFYDNVGAEFAQGFTFAGYAYYDKEGNPQVTMTKHNEAYQYVRVIGFDDCHPEKNKIGAEELCEFLAFMLKYKAENEVAS